MTRRWRRHLLAPTDSAYDLDRLTEQYAGYILRSGEDDDGQMTLYDNARQRKRLIAEAAAITALKEALAPSCRLMGWTRSITKSSFRSARYWPKWSIPAFISTRTHCLLTETCCPEKIAALEKSIYELAGETFNINSPKQLSAILFDKLMLPAPKKQRRGIPQISRCWNYLVGKHPVISLLIDYRELTKLKSTYADGLMKVISADGRIHTDFQMTVTATGRLSSTEPNLQNIRSARRRAASCEKCLSPATEMCSSMLITRR